MGNATLKLMAKTLNLMWKDKVEQQGKKMTLFFLGFIQKLSDPGFANV